VVHYLDNKVIDIIDARL